MTNLGIWKGDTNTTPNSCKAEKCNCSTFWEIYQQEAMLRISNKIKLKSGTNKYLLETGYEARARRIASVYAKIYLEQELSGNALLIGRYYWMGLGAFASKTVAMVFNHGLTMTGYYAPVAEFIARPPVHTFAKGNLWLFMDIAPWHYAWSSSPTSFKQCIESRDVIHFTRIKQSVMNLPWSNCLPKINNLRKTNEIELAFGYLPQIETIFKDNAKSRDFKFRKASKNLLDHLMALAKQEQHNILQEIVWKELLVKGMAVVQNFTGTPDSTLILSSDYKVAAVKRNDSWQYTGRNASILAKLPEEPYLSPLEDTDIPDYDSRMEWITEAAKKYHRLMLDVHGRTFLEKELGIIASWGKSEASFFSIKQPL